MSAKHRALRLGLTGGVGCGKSTAAAVLKELGAAVVDADAISHSLTMAGGAAVEPILAQFGAQMGTARAASTGAPWGSWSSPSPSSAGRWRASSTRPFRRK